MTYAITYDILVTEGKAMPPFSSLIQELRKRTKLSQEKLAGKLGVSFPTVNRWEKGKTQPDTLAHKAVEEFVRKLGVDYADLLEEHFGGPATTTRDNVFVLDVKAMESMLWKAACSIRGEKDAPKFKDYILPLIFIKRLSDVFEDEVRGLATEYGDENTARDIVDADPTLVRFYIPPEAAWDIVSGRKKFEWPAGRKPKSLGEQITYTIRAIAKANPSLQGVIDIVDFNETRNGEREVSDNALSGIIELLSDPRYRLGLHNVEPDFLGRAYEYLLRKFAESQGQSAGEFFTPKEVGFLMAKLVQPRQGEEVYDPCCGSGGLLIKCELELKEREKKINKPLKLYGQEQTGASFAIARMNMIVHDMEGEIVRGNTMANPKFLEDSKLKKFDIVVTNPMWNQDNFDSKDYDSDPFERFAPRGGFAPGSSADWAWLQHVHASLGEKGRAAVVLDTGAASRGSGNQGDNKEKTLRKWFIDNDLIEGVVLLPDNLFYNTTGAAVIVTLNCNKRKNMKGKLVLVNAAAEAEKGRPKNFIKATSVDRIAEAYHGAVDIDSFCRLVTCKDLAKHDYNLSPSLFLTIGSPTEQRDIQELLNEIASLDRDATTLDDALRAKFTSLGFRYERAQ